MKPILLLTLFLLPTFAAAYELNGRLESYDNNDGTYSVVLENEDGHEYMGFASKEPNGSLRLNVSDDKGDKYTGFATEEAEGKYQLDLKNNYSGVTAYGEITEE